MLLSSRGTMERPLPITRLLAWLFEDNDSRPPRKCGWRECDIILPPGEGIYEKWSVFCSEIHDQLNQVEALA